MTNEELLEQLLGEIRGLREEISTLKSTINSQNTMISELRSYIESNSNGNNDIIDNATNEELSKAMDNVVYGEVQANPNEPKSIVLSDQSKLNDNNFYGNDEANYYRNLDKKVVEEYLKTKNENDNDNKDIILEDTKEYIPGTNILKPRNRDYYETDEEYVKYLEEYYKKHFPSEPKGLMTIDNNEPKGLAVLDDVKKPEEIEKLESAINTTSNNIADINNDNDNDSYDFLGTEGLEIDEPKVESRDIYSDSSIKEKLEKENLNSQEKVIDPDDKSEVIEFASEEEKEVFEKGQSIDYKKDNNSKTKKVSKERKAARNFKEVLKKHGKKIIAGVLVAVTAIGAAMSIKACSYDKKDDLSDSKDNSKSNSDEYDATIPSVKAADSFETKDNESFDKSESDSEVTADKIVEDINQKQKKNYDISDSNYDMDLHVGDPVEFTGDYFYTNSYDAANSIDGHTPYYSKDDNRAVSLVQYKGPNGEDATAYTNEDQKVFEDQGWTPVAYNVENLDRDGLTYEAWVNPDDVELVKGK